MYVWRALEFENGVYGMAMNLEEENVGCVLLGEAEDIKEGRMLKEPEEQLKYRWVRSL